MLGCVDLRSGLHACAMLPRRLKGGIISGRMDLHVCRILIASIMEEYDREAWEELIERCEEAGVDAFEINFSCPHGMPERKMGMAMGQDCQLLEVC